MIWQVGKMWNHTAWLNIKCRLALRTRALLDISQFQCLVWRLKRVPAGPECYCSCVNSPSRGSHSYISYYIHHQPPRSPPQNAQKLNFKRHPIDTTGNALVLIYPNIVFYQNNFKNFIRIDFLWFLIKYLPYLREENILDCAVHKSKISFILEIKSFPFLVSENFCPIRWAANLVGAQFRPGARATIKKGLGSRARKMC